MSQENLFNPSTYSSAASLAKTSQTQETWQGSQKESVQDCGLSNSESFAYYDHDTQSLRTWQISLASGLNESLPILPRLGEMRHGRLYRHPQQEQITREIEYLSSVTLPTMSATEYKGAPRKRFRGSTHFRGSRMVEGLRNGLNDPCRISIHFAEAQMGFPQDYTMIE